MRFNYKNRMLGAIGLVFFFTVIWLILNWDFLNKSTNAHLDFALLHNTSGKIDGYFSVKYLSMYYIFSFLFFLRLYVHTENVAIISRLSGRGSFFFFRSKQVIGAATIFVTVIVSINVLGVFLFDHNHLISTDGYVYYTFLNLILLAIYYMWIGFFLLCNR